MPRHRIERRPDRLTISVRSARSLFGIAVFAVYVPIAFVGALVSFLFVPFAALQVFEDDEGRAVLLAVRVALQPFLAAGMLVSTRNAFRALVWELWGVETLRLTSEQLRVERVALFFRDERAWPLTSTGALRVLPPARRLAPALAPMLHGPKTGERGPRSGVIAFDTQAGVIRFGAELNDEVARAFVAEAHARFPYLAG